MQSSLTCNGYVVEDVALLSQRRNDCRYALDKVTASTAPGPKAVLAPEYGGTERAFGGIIRGFSPFDRDSGGKG